MKYYNLCMNVEGRPCLVVGAGTVAARKAASLLECGAHVTVVGENPVAALRRLEGERLTICARRFRPGDMKKPALVFGATDDAEVNSRLSLLSQERGIPVNIVDDPEQSTFIVPAVYRRRDLSIAVSTAGRSPAAASAIKKDLALHYGKDYAQLVGLLGSYRAKMIKSVEGHRRRASLWKKILAADVLGVLRRKGKAAAAGIIETHIEQAKERDE